MARPPKIAVLIESHYDGTETAAFQTFFPPRGYSVEFVSNLRGASEAVFHSNDDPSKTITVTKDISSEDFNLLDYTGVIMVGGYAMDMLRYESIIIEGQNGRPKELPIASQFAVNALKDTEITIGTICHSLWIFTPDPNALKGRRVTCGHNILYDVLNAGGILDFSGPHNQLAAVCIDGNLVSGRHPFVVQDFMDVYLTQLLKKV